MSSIEAFSVLEGSASVAVLFSNLNKVLLATNTGSIYVSQDQSRNMLIFASERDILNQLFRDAKIVVGLNFGSITQIKPNHGYIVNITDLSGTDFPFNSEQCKSAMEENDPESLVKIVGHSPLIGDQSLMPRRNVSTLQPDKRRRSTDDKKNEVPARNKSCTCC